jgi:hypothetical protein
MTHSRRARSTSGLPQAAERAKSRLPSGWALLCFDEDIPRTDKISSDPDAVRRLVARFDDPSRLPGPGAVDHHVRTHPAQIPHRLLGHCRHPETARSRHNAHPALGVLSASRRAQIRTDGGKRGRPRRGVPIWPGSPGGMACWVSVPTQRVRRRTRHWNRPGSRISWHGMCPNRQPRLPISAADNRCCWR